MFVDLLLQRSPYIVVVNHLYASLENEFKSSKTNAVEEWPHICLLGVQPP